MTYRAKILHFVVCFKYLRLLKSIQLLFRKINNYIILNRMFRQLKFELKILQFTSFLKTQKEKKPIILILFAVVDF